MESRTLNNALNVEYKLNIKRIVEYIIQNYIKKLNESNIATFSLPYSIKTLLVSKLCHLKKKR